MKIVKGDLFEHIPPCYTVIPHVVNNKGGWGAGFSGAISEHYPAAEKVYREWTNCSDFQMGNNKWYKHNSTYIVHMLAQNGYKSKDNPVPLDYGALKLCMLNINYIIHGVLHDAQIVAPRFGCGLSGGDKKEIDRLIKEIWEDEKIKVTIYEL